jgi:hypothetical protein
VKEVSSRGASTLPPLQLALAFADKRPALRHFKPPIVSARLGRSRAWIPRKDAGSALKPRHRAGRPLDWKAVRNAIKNASLKEDRRAT